MPPLNRYLPSSLLQGYNGPMYYRGVQLPQRAKESSSCGSKKAAVNEHKVPYIQSLSRDVVVRIYCIATVLHHSQVSMPSSFCNKGNLALTNSISAFVPNGVHIIGLAHKKQQYNTKYWEKNKHLLTWLSPSSRFHSKTWRAGWTYPPGTFRYREVAEFQKI